MSKAAKVDYLEALHKTVAETLMSAMKGEDVTPQLLAQAIKFLKDNGIEPARDADTSVLDALAKKVGEIVTDEDALRDFMN
jgi:hypothetical protein